MALALGAVDNWALRLGESFSSRDVQTRYPVPVSAAGYVLRNGDDRMRDLFLKSLSIIPVEWEDGVSVKKIVAEAPEFIGWGSEPTRMALEGDRHPNTLIADLLTENPVLEFDGKAWFASDHPENVLDSASATFDNDHTATAIDTPMVAAAKQRFREINGANGKPMGLRMTTLLVPPSREQEALDFFEDDRKLVALRNHADTDNVAAVTLKNRHAGTVEVQVCDELNSDDVVYAIAGGTAAFPWVVQDGGAPEQIVYDESDELYKSQGKIGLKYVILMGVKAAMPHSIQRITLS